MLEDYFRAGSTVARLRSGPTGPFLDGFAEDLRQRGYVPLTIRSYVNAVSHLGRWMEQEGIAPDGLDSRQLDAFIAQHRGTRGGGANTDLLAGVRQFLAFLRCQGTIPEVQAQRTDRHPELLARFERWMVRHRGVTAPTLDTYRPMVIEFIRIADEPTQYTAGTVRKFISDWIGRGGRSYAKTLVPAVRMFLRFLVSQGQCDASLVEAIPSIANWKLAALPVYLSADDVDRLLNTPDTSTPVGRRDRAILLLLARLGLRAGDVARMRLGDIDWAAGSILVTGKGRRPAHLPLPQDVGDAILSYLGEGRPRVHDDHVFLRALAPNAPFKSSVAVSDIVNRTAARAHVKPPRGGAHVLRHSVATALVRGGVALSTIQALLRHQSADSTAQYAKVDVITLQKIARPWPLEVSPC